MTHLKQLCASVLDAAGKASARPWTATKTGTCDFMRTIDGVVSSHNRTPYIREETANYIVLAANNAEKLARTLLVMEEALNYIVNDMRSWGAEDCRSWEKKAVEVLAKAEELLGER